MNDIARRTVFFVSDGTGITAETLGHSLLAQFPEARFRQVRAPFIDDIDKAQKMLTTLDEDVVSNLPAALSSDSRTQILVGPENVSKELKDTSVVMTKFDIGDGMQGLIGVVGPTRMDYAQITARLSYFAENLSRMFQENQTPALEEPDNKHHDPEA